MTDKKGSILMIALWILAGLVIFAIGLGHRSAINLRLARYQKEGLKAYYLARGAINMAIDALANDDTLEYDCLTDKWADNETLFKTISLGNNENEYASVSYKNKDSQEPVYGIIDEESRININRNDDLGQKQLSELFKFAGLDEAQAETVKGYIIEWISETVEPQEEKKIFKNGPLKAPEELLVILEYFYQKTGEGDYKKKAQELFNNLKDYITVYGSKNININTASVNVLKILARAVAGINDSLNPEFADTLAEQIIVLRNQPFSSIPDTISLKDQEEINIFNAMKPYISCQSTFFRIEATGYIKDVSKNIITVSSRDGKNISYWHQN